MLQFLFCLYAAIPLPLARKARMYPFPCHDTAPTDSPDRKTKKICFCLRYGRHPLLRRGLGRHFFSGVKELEGVKELSQMFVPPKSKEG